MIQKETKLNVADNSGAKIVQVITLLGGSWKKSSTIGDIVQCSVKASTPGGKVKKGDIVTGIIVRVTKAIQRKDGSTIRFDDNAVVLVDDDGNPIGTRVFGPVGRELREKGEGAMKIVSLAPEVI